MKSLFLSLLKFNITFVVIYISFAFAVGNIPKPYSSHDIKNIAVALWLIGNITVIFMKIIKNRRHIANSVKARAIEAAASVLEFKEVASERAKERGRERSARRNDGND